MKAVFVVGTGRSGTHFTVRLLNGFENAYDPLGGEEDPDVLRDVALAAIHHRLPSERTSEYYRALLTEGKGILLDQHHCNLFFVRHWSNMFDGIIFLYPQRPTYQIVASMLRHKGVMRWYSYAREWRQRTINRIPYPNRFLGIDNASDISTLPPHLLCAHRVIAHRRAYEDRIAEGGGDLRGIDYEALVEDPLTAFSRVFTSDEINSLGEFTLSETPQKTSLVKFRDTLSKEQVAEIADLENRVRITSGARDLS